MAQEEWSVWVCTISYCQAARGGWAALLMLPLQQGGLGWGVLTFAPGDLPESHGAVLGH